MEDALKAQGRRAWAACSALAAVLALVLAVAGLSAALLVCDGTFYTAHAEIYARSGWEACEVRPGLFLGSLQSARDWDGLQEHGVTAVLNAVAVKFPDKFPGRFEGMDVYIADRKVQDLLSYLPATTAWLMEQASRNQTILVHCEEGRSRSVSIMIAYLMASEGLDYNTAKADVEAARPQARINSGFKAQLRDYEGLLADYGPAMPLAAVTPAMVAEYDPGEGYATRARNPNHLTVTQQQQEEPAKWPLLDWLLVAVSFLVLLVALVRLAMLGHRPSPEEHILPVLTIRASGDSRANGSLAV